MFLFGEVASPQVYDHIQTITHGATGAQIMSVVFLGGLFVIGMVWLIWRILDFRLKPLADVPETLTQIEVSLSKLWSRDQLTECIDNRVNEALHDHVSEYHRQT